MCIRDRCLCRPGEYDTVRCSGGAAYTMGAKGPPESTAKAAETPGVGEYDIAKGTGGGFAFTMAGKAGRSALDGGCELHPSCLLCHHPPCMSSWSAFAPAWRGNNPFVWFTAIW